jgi:hypothetical protein
VLEPSISETSEKDPIIILFPTFHVGDSLMDALIEKIELFLLSGGYFPKGFNLEAFLEESKKKES